MINKKVWRAVLAMILAVLMCLPASISVYAANPNLTVTGPDSVKPGETFTVSINVNDNPGIAGFELVVNFDTSKLALVKAEAGAKMASRSITLNTDEGKPISSYREITANYSQATNFKTTGEYIKITFKAIAGTSGGATVTARMASAANQSLQLVSFTPGTKLVNITSDSGNQGGTTPPDVKKLIELKAGADKIKYIKGYPDGTFKPNQAATRYEVVEALAKVFDINVESKPSGLVDVDPKYAAQVDLFTTAGIIDGFPGKIFGGNQNITRAQFCKIIAVMMDLNIKNPKNGGFKDVSGWAKVYIDACAEAGLVKGKDEAKKLFDPSANITRAELATLVNRITGALDSGTSCKYPDVIKGKWYYGWVAAAAE